MWALVGWASSAPIAPTSVEYKLSLQPARFAEGFEAAREVWAWAVEIAAAEGYMVAPLPWVEKHREITFLDTQDAALRAAGYTLRVRTDLSGRKLLPEEKKEYTLKFRAATAQEMGAADLRVARLPGEREWEQDWVFHPSRGIEARYAARVLVETDWTVRPKVSAWARWFPALGEIGLPPEAPILPVREPVHEVRVSPGRVSLDGALWAKVDIGVWYGSDGSPVAAEISFDHEAWPSAGPSGERLLTALGDQAGAWAGEGTSKTDLTYGGAR